MDNINNSLFHQQLKRLCKKKSISTNNGAISVYVWCLILFSVLLDGIQSNQYNYFFLTEVPWSIPLRHWFQLWFDLFFSQFSFLPTVLLSLFLLFLFFFIFLRHSSNSLSAATSSSPVTSSNLFLMLDAMVETKLVLLVCREQNKYIS